MNTHPIPVSEAWLQPCHNQENQNIAQCRKILELNRKSQEQLKELRNNISERLQAMDQFLMTYKVQTEYPQPHSLISYLKFQRNVPDSYNKQLRIYENNVKEKSTVKKVNQQQLFEKLNNQPSNKSQQFFFEDQEEFQEEIVYEKKNSSKSKKGEEKGELQKYRKWCIPSTKQKIGDKFNSEEDKIILAKKKLYKDWQKISQFVNYRNIDQVYYQFSNRLNPNLINGRWNLTHTLMLIILIEHFGCKKWGKISQKMVWKNQLQVRQRFCNLIDPNIGKDIWTPQMEKRVLEIAEEYDFCWRKISLIPFFNNKTDNCVWRKWKILMQRFTKDEIRIMLPETPKFRGLAEKVIKDKETFERKKRAPGSKIQAPIFFGRFSDKQAIKDYGIAMGYEQKKQIQGQVIEKYQKKKNQIKRNKNQLSDPNLSPFVIPYLDENNVGIQKIREGQVIEKELNDMLQYKAKDDLLKQYQQDDQNNYILYDINN